MHLKSLFPFAAALALAACGEEQTAEAPATPTSPTVVETAQAPATPPASATNAPAPAAPSAPATAPAEATGTVTASPSAGRSQTAAVSATSLQSFQGRAYSAGPISLQLNPDNTFVMKEVEGNKKVEGRYAYENGVLILSEPKGDIGGATFPMRCRFETAGASEFRLADSDGACTRFKDLTFKPAAG